MTSAFIRWYLNCELSERLAHFLNYMAICQLASDGLTSYIPRASFVHILRVSNSDEKLIDLHERFDLQWDETLGLISTEAVLSPGSSPNLIKLCSYMKLIRDEFQDSLLCHRCLDQSGYTVLKSSGWQQFGISGSCNICERTTLLTHPQALDKIIELNLGQLHKPLEIETLSHLVHKFSLTDILFSILEDDDQTEDGPF